MTKRPGPARRYPAARKPKRKLPPRYKRPKETAEERKARMERGERLAETLTAAIGGFIDALFGGRPQRSRTSEPSSELEAELLRTGYRKLAEKYHPDKEGGDPEKMKELNRLKEKLGL